MSANPLLDGTLVVTVGGHDFTDVLLSGLSYSNTNPGGFGEATFRIAATSPHAAYVRSGHTMAKGDAVAIEHGSGPTTLFEGVITNDVTHAIIEGGFAYYEVTCAGLWWKAGLRGDYCRVWGDDDYGQWFELGSNAKSFQVDTDGKAEIRLEQGQSAKANKACCLYYWLNEGMGDPAEETYYLVANIVADVNAGNWYARISGSDSPWGTWTTIMTLWDMTTSASYAIDVSGYKALRLRLWSDADVAGVAADRYVTMTDISVLSSSIDAKKPITGISVANPTTVTCVAHGLVTGDRVYILDSDSTPNIDGWRTITKTGTNTFTVPVNVTSRISGVGDVLAAKRVDEAMADIAVTTGLAASADLETDGIGALNWGLNVRPHTSRADAIETLAANHSAPIDYGFWESAVFYCKLRPATPLAAGRYTIDSEVPGIDFNVFANTEDSPTHVKVLYKFRDVDGGTSVYPDGTLRAVYRPSTPTWADAGVVLDVWDQWSDLSLTTAQAEAIGDQILAWLAYNQYVGTITIATPTVPLYSGGTKLTAYIRAGDTIIDSDLTISRSVITSVVVDADSGVATLGIGETRKEFVARITAPMKPVRFDPHPGMPRRPLPLRRRG